MVATARDNRCGGAGAGELVGVDDIAPPWVLGRPSQESQIGGPTEWFWTLYGHGDAAERLLTPPPRYPIPRLGRGRDPGQAADLVAPPSIVVGGSKHTIVHEPTLTEGAGLGESRNTAAETERDRLLHPELGAQMSPFIVPLSGRWKLRDVSMSVCSFRLPSVVNRSFGGCFCGSATGAHSHSRVDVVRSSGIRR